MAEADLHADEAGGDFAGEAERLGAAVAAVHADLAAAFGTTPTTRRPSAQPPMHARLDRRSRVVPELDEVAEGLREIYDAVAATGGTAPCSASTATCTSARPCAPSSRWVLIDFEGEPMATLDERRRPDSPLRDVAGMLRSFEYAGYHQVIEAGCPPQLPTAPAEWTERNRGAFLAGYADASGADLREHGVLLRAFEADKAVYEAVYEARNRPAWLAIPLASLARLAKTEDAS